VYNLKVDKLKYIGQILNLRRLVIFILAFLFSYSILMTSVVTRKYSLKEGDIVKTDIKAPREIIDEKATEKRIQQAEAAIGEKYEKKPEIKQGVIDSIRSFFSKVNTQKDSALEEKDKINALKQDYNFDLKNEEYSLLLSVQKEDIKTLQSVIISSIGEIYDNMTINNGNQDDITKAREALGNKINNSTLSNDIKELGKDIVKNQIKPNFFYDEAKTSELRKNAAKEILPVVIKKDQIIAKEGEPVTLEEIQILNELGLLNNSSTQQGYIYISLGVLLITVMFLQWVYLYKYYKSVFMNYGKLTLINILNCVGLLLCRTLALISPFLIPLACIPMLMMLLINYKISITLSIMNCILISILVGFNTEIIIIAILNAVLGGMVLRKMQARNDIIYASLYIAIINAIITFSIGIILSNNIVDVLNKTGSSSLGAVIAGVLTIGILPICETSFDIVTAIKLLELLNPNQPLLKQLLLEAPGTYHHSIMVANLAEVATEQVKGNAILARVGAYYHDVGKIRRPYFFKENQLGNDNPHNKITPSLSALIVISHVKDGLELAKEAKIPSEIRDIILQHHGNSLVKYFYVTMRNSAANPDDIKEEDFRYPGPPPKSKESAIIMLADSVEASVRSIVEPDAEKIEAMVNSIFKDRLNDGQLNNCDLTLRDVESVRKSFLKSLSGIYHQRIEYPQDKALDKSK
jgi:putative nucleotidyltransferase with HDIG domain